MIALLCVIFIFQNCLYLFFHILHSNMLINDQMCGGITIVLSLYQLCCWNTSLLGHKLICWQFHVLHNCIFDGLLLFDLYFSF